MFFFTLIKGAAMSIKYTGNINDYYSTLLQIWPKILVDTRITLTIKVGLISEGEIEGLRSNFKISS